VSARVVLVTGAGRGLARGIAVDLARAGHRVAITYRPGGTPPDATLAAIRAVGGRAYATAADHREAGATAAAVRAVAGALGSVEILVHAAGPMRIARFERTSSVDDAEAISGNLLSAVEAARSVLPPMRAAGFGRLVFFGMNGSHATAPARGLSLYAAAKAGVVAFARSLALEEARYGITSNVVEPGDIRRKDVDRAGAREIAANNPTGHAGSWEDVADAVRFLVSDTASFFNGMTLNVNGGLVGPHE